MALEWTVTQGAEALGMSVEGLAKRLKACGLPTKRGHKYSLSDAFKVASIRDTNKEAMATARRNKIEEEAALLKLEREEKEKQLVRMDDVLIAVRAPHMVVRQRMLALPSEAAHKCNPADPELAREALQGWVDYSLASIREELPKPTIGLDVKPPESPKEVPA